MLQHMPPPMLYPMPGTLGSQSSLAVDSLPPAAVILAMQHHEAAEAAARHGHHHHHRHPAVAPAANPAGTLGSLAPDVAAAAIAAAAGNYHPLMMMQYLAQTGQATPMQLQQLAAVHQVGPAAAAAAWHAAASAAGSGVPAPQQVLFAAGLTAAARLAAAQHTGVLIAPPAGGPLQAAKLGPKADGSEDPSPPGSSGAVPRLSTLAEPRHRRALALDKYRQKRKNLKFAKTIRYESRKQLAHSRPRVKGQFVKHEAGGGRDDGGSGAGGAAAEADDDEDEDEEAEEMAAADREEDAQARYGGQNFDEEGAYDNNGDDAMEDEEGGAGGSGTEAGDANKRCASGAVVTGVKRKAVPNNSHSSPELTPPREELGEEDDDVVNSLEKLREGPPRAHFCSKSPEKAVGAAAIISPGGLDGVVLNLSRGAATHHYRPHKQPHADAGEGSLQLGGHHHLGLVGAAVKATGTACEDGPLGRSSGKNGSDSGSNSPDENGGSGKGGAGNGSSNRQGCVGNALESHDEGSGHGSVAEGQQA